MKYTCKLTLLMLTALLIFLSGCEIGGTSKSAIYNPPGSYDEVNGTFYVKAKSINIDAPLDEWDTVEAIIIDDVNDTIDGDASSDIWKLFVAQDDNFVYFRFDLVGAFKFPHHPAADYSHYEIGIHLHKNSECSDTNPYYILNNFTSANGERYGPQFDNYLDDSHEGALLDYSVQGNTMMIKVPLAFFNTAFSYLSFNPYIQSFKGDQNTHHDVTENNVCLKLDFHADSSD